MILTNLNYAVNIGRLKWDEHLSLVRAHHNQRKKVENIYLVVNGICQNVSKSDIAGGCVAVLSDLWPWPGLCNLGWPQWDSLAGLGPAVAQPHR